MFKVEMDLYDFENIIGFWGGDKDRWIKYSEEDKDYLNEVASCCLEFNSLSQVNGFIWFDADDILKEEEEENE